MITVSGSPNESSFMSAADKNIKDLQAAVVILQSAATAARVDATAARKAADTAQAEAKRWKALTVALAFVTVCALVASSLSIYNWVRQADSTNQLRKQAIASCEQNNASRAAEVVVWSSFIDLLVKGDPKPKDQAGARQFKAYIASHLAPRDCQQVYNASANGR